MKKHLWSSQKTLFYTFQSVFAGSQLKYSYICIYANLPVNVIFFFKLGFTPCKAEQPLRGMELQEKKNKKDCRIQKVCLERTYS